MQGPGFSIIPTRCPKFLAACATVGIGLQKGTPGISNTYSLERKYDPEEPGDISFCISSQNGRNPLAIAKIWRDPSPDFIEAAGLKQALLKCKDAEQWGKLASDVDALNFNCGIGSMSLFASGKFTVDSITVSDQEREASLLLHQLPEAMRRGSYKDAGRVAAKLSEAWNPAMFAWVKAWISNYHELRDAWKAARPAIKIERDGAFPLIIPKGKDFYKLLKRWT